MPANGTKKGDPGKIEETRVGRHPGSQVKKGLHVGG